MALDAGAIVDADDFAEPADDLQPSFMNATSTSYTDAITGGTDVDCATTFTAPTSGNVIIHFFAQLDNSGANTTYASPEVREGGTIGAGTVVSAATDDDALRLLGTSEVSCAGFRLLTGLTGAATYNVRLLHRVTGGTATIYKRNVLALPTQ